MRRAAWSRAALLPNGKLLRWRGGWVSFVEESVGAADVDLADIARTLGGARLLDEAKVSVSSAVLPLERPSHSCAIMRQSI